MLERALAAPPTVERPVVEPTALDFVVAPPIDTNVYLNATTLAADGLEPEEDAARCGLPAGEARLLASLASLASARVRREQAGCAAAGHAAADASVSAGTTRSAAGSAEV